MEGGATAQGRTGRIITSLASSDSFQAPRVVNKTLPDICTMVTAHRWKAVECEALATANKRHFPFVVKTFQHVDFRNLRQKPWALASIRPPAASHKTLLEVCEGPGEIFRTTY
jgi:hypothetical protein